MRPMYQKVSYEKRLMMDLFESNIALSDQIQELSAELAKLGNQNQQIIEQIKRLADKMEAV